MARIPPEKIRHAKTEAEDIAATTEAAAHGLEQMEERETRPTHRTHLQRYADVYITVIMLAAGIAMAVVSSGS